MRETHFEGAVAGCEDRESGLGWGGVGCVGGFSGEHECVEVVICEVVWITRSFSGSCSCGGWCAFVWFGDDVIWVLV